MKQIKTLDISTIASKMVDAYRSILTTYAKERYGEVYGDLINSGRYTNTVARIQLSNMTVLDILMHAPLITAMPELFGVVLETIDCSLPIEEKSKIAIQEVLTQLEEEIEETPKLDDDVIKFLLRNGAAGAPNSLAHNIEETVSMIDEFFVHGELKGLISNVAIGRTDITAFRSKLNYKKEYEHSKVLEIPVDIPESISSSCNRKARLFISISKETQKPIKALVLAGEISKPLSNWMLSGAYQIVHGKPNSMLHKYYDYHRAVAEKSGMHSTEAMSEIAFNLLLSTLGIQLKEMSQEEIYQTELRIMQDKLETFKYNFLEGISNNISNRQIEYQSMLNQLNELNEQILNLQSDHMLYDGQELGEEFEDMLESMFYSKDIYDFSFKTRRGDIRLEVDIDTQITNYDPDAVKAVRGKLLSEFSEVSDIKMYGGRYNHKELMEMILDLLEEGKYFVKTYIRAFTDISFNSVELSFTKDFPPKDGSILANTHLGTYNCPGTTKMLATQAVHSRNYSMLPTILINSTQNINFLDSPVANKFMEDMLRKMISVADGTKQDMLFADGEGNTIPFKDILFEMLGDRNG